MSDENTVQTKAPGKAFRKGMTLVELIRKFPDNKAAEAWITEIRWPDGPECPRCGCDNVQHPTSHKTMPYRCRGNGCRRFFSVRVGTVMQDSKLRLSGVGDCCVSVQHVAQVSVEHEAAPRSGHLTEIGVASGASDSSVLERHGG